ncbi:MAG: hypothetical protein NC314_08550 [Roseburia sp.]|nr:hypothetical protein [Roseburia sp.]MCM1242876.1 hypothetical protein [Roseburia sp.]
MFSLIWTIVLCIIIFNVVKQKKEQGRQNKEPNGQYPPPGIPQNQRYQGNHQQMQKNQRRMGAQQTLSNTSKSVQTLPDDEPEAGSTLAYLEEKARQDAMEHAKEKQEEAQRLHKNYGGLRVAERLYEGNSVPDGKRCIVCGYCGAENLVPMMPRERYSCFFCREPIN